MQSSSHSSSTFGCAGPRRRALLRAAAVAMLLVTAQKEVVAQCQAQWLPGDGFDMRGSSSPWVQRVVGLPNGDVIAHGSFDTAGGIPGFAGIARWNGSVWADIGAPHYGFGFPLQVLGSMPNGDLLATVGDDMRRWNGAAWIPLGNFGGGSVRAVVVPNGDLIAYGTFNSAGGVLANNVARFAAG